MKVLAPIISKSDEFFVYNGVQGKEKKGALWGDDAPRFGIPLLSAISNTLIPSSLSKFPRELHCLISCGV